MIMENESMISLYRKTVYHAYVIRSKEQWGTSWSAWDTYKVLRALPDMLGKEGLEMVYDIAI